MHNQRMHLITRAAAFLALVTVCAAARAAQTNPLVRVENDIEYGRVGAEALRLDLYEPAEPATTASRPAVVFIHGGGWSGGDKREFAGNARDLAARGYVAISVNYRLAPKYRYPAAVDDVQRAVWWLRRNAATYHVDPERVAAMGSSAGGHLAAFLGVTDVKEPGAGTSSRVQCVVDYYGRMDLRDNQSGPGFTDYRPGFIGATLEAAPALYTAASPITHVDAHTAPFLLVHGTRDTQVAPLQAHKMLAALEKAGIEASLYLLAGSGHGFGGEAGVDAWQVARMFLDRHLVSPHVAPKR